MAMQKKEIEKIPFAGRKKGKAYYLISYIHTLQDEERVLITDVYDEKRAIRRYCIDAENYNTYLPEEKTWTRRKIATGGYYYSAEFTSGYHRDIEQITVAKGTSKAIKEYTGKCPIGAKDIIEAIYSLQDKINDKKEVIKSERRREKSKEASSIMPEMSEAFKKFARESMGENSFYFAQQGDDIFLTCSKCGKTDHIKGKALAFARKRECYFCGCEVTRIRKLAEDTDEQTTETFSDVRPYKNGVAIIQVDVTKSIHIAKPEKWKYEEIGAAVFFKNRKTQDIYWKEGELWSKNPRKERQGSYGYYGGYKTMIPEGGWAPEYAKKTLKKAGFEHTGYDFYGRQLYAYLRTWTKRPEIEYLSKMNLNAMVDALINNSYLLKDINTEGKNFEEIFSIRPDRKKFLIEQEGDLQIWSILRAEHRQRGNWGEDTILFFKKNIEKYNEDKLFKILTIEKMTAEKLKNYLKKQVVHYISVNLTLQEYYDYLQITKDLGYDLANPIILFPRNLEDKHGERLIERNKEKNIERAVEYEKKFENVKKNYKKLKKRFGYKTNAFTIRPARSCTEIVNEGLELHHCVGATDTYCRRHNEGRTFILFMRKNENPDKPWCTIEIGNDGKIRQWFEAYDKKPDEALIEPVLKEYIEQLGA